jgi:hypothetical protein
VTEEWIAALQQRLLAVAEQPIALQADALDALYRELVAVLDELGPGGDGAPAPVPAPLPDRP